MTRAAWCAAALSLATGCASACAPPPPAAPEEPDNRWTDLTLGFYHGCGIRGNGDIRCWSGAPIPVRDTGADAVMDASLLGTFPGPFASVALNHPYPYPGHPETVCGVLRAGGASCWGGFPFIADGVFSAFYPDGYGNGCGLLSEGGGRCVWYGQDRELPMVTAMSMSEYHLALIDVAGGLTLEQEIADEGLVTLVVAGSWKAIEGDGRGAFCGLQVGGTLSCWDFWTRETPPPVLLSAPTGTYHQVCLTNYDQACVLDAAGKATCWGAEPMEAPDETFTKLACGNESVCGLTDDGRIVCWGDCDNGECEVPTYE